jgi:hypothetical protein
MKRGLGSLVFPEASTARPNRGRRPGTFITRVLLPVSFRFCGDPSSMPGEMCPFVPRLFPVCFVDLPSFSKRVLVFSCLLVRSTQKQYTFFSWIHVVARVCPLLRFGGSEGSIMPCLRPWITMVRRLAWIFDGR